MVEVAGRLQGASVRQRSLLLLLLLPLLLLLVREEVLLEVARVAVRALAHWAHEQVPTICTLSIVN